ncbi:MAG TPA: alpha/beta hydrolase [Rhizomicrobium sp.]|nr:alpha/beta hydrolase [Rhizomicrobium sp.]
MLPAAKSFSPFFLAAGAVKLRAARFEADGPGVCLILTGQTEFIEKYFEVIDEFRAKGFSVITFDWRGQGGSDRLLPNRRKAHIDNFAEYDQDLDTVIREVVKPMVASLPRARSADGGGARSTNQVRRAEGEIKPIVVAHSMGGNILLRRLHDVQGDFAAAILSAPMVGIKPRGVPWWLVEKIADRLNRDGPSRDFVWGMGKRDQLKLPFALQIVTSDPKRYARNQALLAADPELRLNGPTWGWLGAALHAIDHLEQPGYAEAIKTPSLVIGAGRDRVCDTEAAHAFTDRMSNAQYVEIAGAQHEILMERDPLRAEWWAAANAFLKKNAPAVSR